MDKEVPDAKAIFAGGSPWLAVYPPGAPARVDSANYALLGDLARDMARRKGDAPAFTTVMPNGMSASLSFAQLDSLSDAMAAYLREVLRLEPGQRVAVQIPNGLAYPVAAFGTFKAGCVLVNINPLYKTHEITHVFADAEPSAIIALNLMADRLGEALKETPIPHVIVSEAASFFPSPSRRLIGFVQKYIRRELPPMKFRHTPIARALAVGAQQVARGANILAYTKGLDSSAIACLQYTGGTTGVSKGAMLTHRNLIMNVAQFTSFRGDDMRPSDHVLAVLPLYHIFAFTVNLLGFFMRGAHNVLIPNPRPLSNLRKAFEKHQVSFVVGVNTLFNGLLNEPWFCANPPKSLRMSLAGGMTLQAAVATRWQEITGTPITEGYGLTEASPVLTVNPLGREKLGTIGIPLPSTEMKCVKDDGSDAAIGEPGEIIARGPQVMPGYWRQPAETANALRGGWLYTGDIGTMDAEGYFRIVERRKDMILVSGFNVYPNEVEEVLSGLPGVKECAVVGVPDPLRGEAVKAFIVRSDPELGAADVREFCRTELTDYKVPKFIEFREELPKSNVGKILRKELRTPAH
jgi:long-chain acyl-CoA synthetase